METNPQSQVVETAANQAVLTAALRDLWNSLYPDTRFNEEAGDLIESVAARHAAALCQANPNILAGLSAGDLDRIEASLVYHFEMTENTSEDECNQALVSKLNHLAALTQPAPPSNSRSRSRTP